MSSAGDEEVAAAEQQRTLSVVSTAVSVVAAVFLGGGFYYGMTKQQKALAEEEKNADKTSTSKKEFKPKPATLFEKKLALDKPLPPSTAAWKALFGVTLVSVTGCCLLVGGAAAALGVTNLKQLDFEGLGEVKREILDVIADEVKEEELHGNK
ncbi:hypothetical protein PHYSODRAFT_523335 [Phytophthora sojae]|uniref:Transmembrane protein 242 n=1 Tax=Phytophthora sojae (strain P6497) TaxID=1094619 RepID=G5A4M9_PHYSP|nr:hypothetical protein PHYSODRAFT_523335 [Phytophthora sojae]EGZ09629.1 hypothetical protein PHYSODRAFT_523335 [Phytophthora sojae]|eukprot:XP_009534490.1 hypothetical protein PHYSODRAFT_523335 [Phytophthora sojae]